MSLRALHQFHRLAHGRVRWYAIEKAQLIEAQPQGEQHIEVECTDCAIQMTREQEIE